MTYDYKCSACGREFELEQKITARPATQCPRCGRHEAKRLISSGNFMLMGKGWYKDGYQKSV